MQSGDNLAVLAAYSIEFTMVQYLETISRRQIAAPVLKMGVLTDDFLELPVTLCKRSVQRI